mgnify:CR=1 FL=1
MLAKNIAILTLIYAAKLLVPLLVIPVLARVVDSDSYGIYMYAISFATWLSIFIEYGFNLSSTRDVASSQDLDEISGIVRGTESAKLLLTLATLPLLFVALVWLPPFQGASTWAITAWILGVLLAFSPTYYFQGRERLRVVGLAELGSGAAILIGVLTLVNTRDDFVRLPWIILIPRVTATVALIIAMHHGTVQQSSYRPSLALGWQFIRRGSHFFVFQAAVSLYTTFNVVFLGFFCTPAQVGAYATAEKLMRAGLGFIAQFSAAIFPRLNAIKASNTAKMERLRTATLCGFLVLGLAGIVFTRGISSTVAEFLLGRNFGEVEALLDIMAFVIPAIAMSNVLGLHFLIVDRHEKIFNFIIIAAAFINLALAYFMVTRHGVHGMASAWVCIEWLIAAATGLVVLKLRVSRKIEG